MATPKKPRTAHKKRGQPTKCTPENIAKAAKAASEGALDWEIAEVIGVHPQRLSEWKGKYPEFAEALKAAREKPLEAVEASMFRSAMGYTHREEKIFYSHRTGKIKRIEVMKHYPPNPASAALFMRIRRPELFQNNPQPTAPVATLESKPKTFAEFCEKAGYPKPFPKQEEMRAFGIDNEDPRLLLGARKYGKTDYVTVLGVAYAIYLDFLESQKTGKQPSDTTLIMTKSDERNSAMIEEIRKAAEANGVPFEKANASCLRVKGLLGKDHSVSTVTVGTSSLRGRHPKRIIMDDPVTEDDVSEATRKRVQRKYNELSKLSMNILVVGQPVHKADLYGTLRPLLKKMEVPHGSIPELDADLEAMKLAGISEESISASYHLKVVSETGFPLEDIQLIDAFPPGDSVAFIDPAFGSSKGGDYTALTVLKGYFDGVAVQGHVWRRAWNHCLPEIVERLISLGVKRVGFETNSLGDMPLNILREALAPHGIGVVGKCSTSAKHSRIMNAGTYSKLIHLSKGSDRVYIEQVVNYEYGVKNDDAPDSLASCLEMVGLIRGAKT